MEATTIELDGQYRALREEAGVCDRDVALITVRGPEAIDYLQGQLTQEVETLIAPSERAPGCGAYSALLDRKGHMKGDMRVLRTAEDDLLLLTEPEAVSAVAGHLGMYKVGREVEVAEETEGHALVSVIGPAASERVLGGPLSPEHAHREANLAGVGCRAIATDLGIDLLCEAADLEALRDGLTAAGVAPVSEEAAEIVRVEAGRPRFGHEMTTKTIPQEAGINERAISFTKGCYIGQETVARLHYKGKANRHLRGLVLDAPASAGDPLSVGEKQVGVIGTAVTSPALGPIALAIVRREAEPGNRVAVGDANAADVVAVPFQHA